MKQTMRSIAVYCLHAQNNSNIYFPLNLKFTYYSDLLYGEVVSERCSFRDMIHNRYIGTGDNDEQNW